MKKISKYQIFTELQHGPITRVYKAVQPELQRMVLVKQLNPDRVTDDELVERFKQEGSILAKINSPNVITIFDFGYENGVPFLVTEFIEGSTLAGLLKQVGMFPWDIGLYILQQIAAGVGAIHLQNLVHQDIKPENIFISDQGEVKLGDLGFSISLAETEKPVQGTPAYLPPEVILTSESDFRSDLYSLGLVCYEIVTGENPFAAEDMQTIFKRIINLNPIKINGVRPDIPADFSEIVSKLMNHNPEERFQSAHDLLQNLEAVRESRRVKVDRDSLVSFLHDPGAYHITPEIDAPKAAPAPVQAPPKQRRIWLTAGFIVTAMIVIFFVKQLNDGFSFFKKTDNFSAESQQQNTAPVDSAEHVALEDDATNESSKNSGMPISDHANLSNAANDTMKLPIVAELKQDTIKISSDPKAIVFLNRDSLGITPLQFYASARNEKLQLEFRAPGFPIINKTVAPTEAAAQNFHINLWKEVAYLNVEILPWGEIWIDGDSVDVSPTNRLIVLTPGNHRLMARHPVLKNVNVPIYIAVGETLKKTIELSR